MFQLTPARLAQVRAGESLIGAMIGVGVFGLPFAFVKAGFFVGLAYLVVLGLVVMTLQMMMAEVSLQTKGRHRLAGYIRRYFGKRWGFVSALVSLAMSWGALVAYVLVGAEFVHALLSPWLGGSMFLYQMVFLGVGFVVALRGLKLVAQTEAYLVAALVLAMVTIIARGMIHVDPVHLFKLDSFDLFLPYGVVLFSLGGISIVPELVDMMGRYKQHVRGVVLWATLAVIGLYGLFVTVVVGVSGANTTPEAIEGLAAVMGPWVLVLGSLLGFFAVSTSFLLHAITIQDLLEYDYNYTRLLAWFLALSVPTLVMLAGARDFIEVMSFTGGVFGGLIAIMAGALYLRVRKRYCSPEKCFYIPQWLCWIMIGIFVLGAGLELTLSILS